jgi:hypothetical protein
MNTVKQRAELAVNLLESVLTGSLDPESAISRWPSIDDETNRLMKNTWHQLYHYFQDADIRSERASYDEAQQERLRARITELKALISG